MMKRRILIQPKLGEDSERVNVVRSRHPLLLTHHRPSRLHSTRQLWLIMIISYLGIDCFQPECT